MLYTHCWNNKNVDLFKQVNSVIPDNFVRGELETDTFKDVNRWREREEVESHTITSAEARGCMRPRMWPDWQLRSVITSVNVSTCEADVGVIGWKTTWSPNTHGPRSEQRLWSRCGSGQHGFVYPPGRWDFTIPLFDTVKFKGMRVEFLLHVCSRLAGWVSDLGIRYT